MRTKAHQYLTDRVSAGPPPRRASRWRRATGTVVTLLVLGWAFVGVGVSPAAIATGWSGGVDLAAKLFHPDFTAEYLAIVGHALVETIQMSVVGLAIAALIGFPLSILIAGNSQAPPVLRSGARWTAAFLRGVPDLLWALLLVAALGPGPAAGALALGIHGGGMLAKLGAEQFEAVDPRPVEALRLMGAGRVAVSFLAVIPQAAAGCA